MKILLILLSSFSLFANTIQIEFNSIKIDVSEECASKNCDALKNLKMINLKKMKEMEDKLRGGKTLGEEVCRKVFKVDVITHRDKEMSEQNFCHFKDLSSISTDQVSKYIYDQIYPDRSSEK